MHPLARRAALLAAQRQPLLALLASSSSSGRASTRALSSGTFSSSIDDDQDPYDVVIVGGGMVGAALAALLRAESATSALRVAIVDRAPPPTTLPRGGAAALASVAPDSRVSTLTPASLAALERAGAWERLRPLSAEFRHMQVWDALGQGHVRWSAPAAAAAAAAATSGAGGGGGSMDRDGDTGRAPVMGAVAENSLLQAALLEAALEKRPGGGSGGGGGGGGTGGCLDLLAPAGVEALALPPYSPHERPLRQHGGMADEGDEQTAETRGGDRLAELTLSPSSAPGPRRVLRARLVVGADGARSRVRDLAGIRAPEWPAYGQRAVVATVRVEEGLAGAGAAAGAAAGGGGLDTAWQVFLPEGPLALLPVRGTGLANVVWSTTPRRAAELEAMGSGDAFAAAVDAALRRGGGGGGLGASPSAASALTGAAAAVGAGLAAATSLASAALGPLLGGRGGSSSSSSAADDASSSSAWRAPPRVVGMPAGAQPPRSFPLAARHAGRYVRPRLALVGDAAHAVHPLAGQGVNLGLGDAAALAAAIAGCARSGGDLGAVGFLRREYEEPRRRANGRMMAALDGVQRIFALGGPSSSSSSSASGAVFGGGAAAAAAAAASALPPRESALLLGAVRGAGLAALNAFPQLRDAFVLEYAMASGG